MVPQLLFLPGVGADPAFWRPLGELLPPSWRKTYMGWPGLGAQPRDPAVNSYDDLYGLVESAMGDGPVDLIAQSMGGAIALAVALRHPGRVRRLVLTATSGGVDMGALGATDWRADYRKSYPNAAPWITDWRPDMAELIGNIPHPALLLWGDADPISPLAVGQRLATLLANARLHVVPGGDHGFARDRPKAVVDLIAHHLR